MPHQEFRAAVRPVAGGAYVGRRSWQKVTRFRNMFWSVQCRGVGLCRTRNSEHEKRIL